MDLKEILGKNFKVTVFDFSSFGTGVSKVTFHDKRLIVFVPHAVVGDELLIQINKVQSRYVFGKIIQIIVSGPSRITSDCPYSFSTQNDISCGGCASRHIQIQQQTHLKFQSFQSNFDRAIDKNITFELDTHRFHQRYRNKLQIHFFPDKDGHACTGFFHEESSILVPIQDCLLHPKPMIDLSRFICQKLNEWDIPAYDVQTKKGWMKKLIVRYNFDTSKMIAIFITRGINFPKQQLWVDALQDYPGLIGVCQNENQSDKHIFGKYWKKLFGDTTFIEKISFSDRSIKNLELRTSVSSFFQINTQYIPVLYQTILAYTIEENMSHFSLLLDLYSGIGGISLTCADHFKTVIGVDNFASSVADAKYNAKLNKKTNVLFEQNNTEKFLKIFLKQPKQNQSCCIIVDPPRTGCHKDVLYLLLRISAYRIVYVSCNWISFIRDMKILREKYIVKKIKLFDMFPYTSHIEIVAQLVWRTENLSLE